VLEEVRARLVRQPIRHVISPSPPRRRRFVVNP
jgi:hypothetical protein